MAMQIGTVVNKAKSIERDSESRAILLLFVWSIEREEPAMLDIFVRKLREKGFTDIADEIENVRRTLREILR